MKILKHLIKIIVFKHFHKSKSVRPPKKHFFLFTPSVSTKTNPNRLNRTYYYYLEVRTNFTFSLNFGIRKLTYNIS